MKLSIIVLAIYVLGIVGYVMNIYKLATSDFASPYKAEVIRTIGVLTPIGAVTGFITIKD